MYSKSYYYLWPPLPQQHWNKTKLKKTHTKTFRVCCNQNWFGLWSLPIGSEMLVLWLVECLPCLTNSCPLSRYLPHIRRNQTKSDERTQKSEDRTVRKVQHFMTINMIAMKIVLSVLLPFQYRLFWTRDVLTNQLLTSVCCFSNQTSLFNPYNVLFLPNGSVTFLADICFQLTKQALQGTKRLKRTKEICYLALKDN